MGKNPNAKKLKVKKHKETKEYSNDVEDLEDEAARLGCELWELEQVKKDLEEKKDEDNDNDEEDKDGETATKEKDDN